MAFKELTSLDADVTTALGGRNKKTGKPNPKTVEGYYLGSRQVDSKKSKSGKAHIHFLQTEAGNLGVWGKTDLDRKIIQVEPGTMVRITHTGMTPTPNGDMYKFKVEQDGDNTIEVNLAQTETSSNFSEDDTTGETDSGEETSEEEVQDDDSVTQNAVAAAAQRAKVEALLAGKGKSKTK